jgi:hypothetical protein
MNSWLPGKCFVRRERKAAKQRMICAVLVAIASTTLLAFAGIAVPAQASTTVTFDGSPGTGPPPATLGPFTMTKFGTDFQPAGGTLVPGVNDPAGNISFGPSLYHYTVGAGWATWSNGYTGDVYDLGQGSGGSVTVTLPAGTDAFYLYAEPNPFAVIDITATTNDGTTSGSIPVQGDGGAQYFGFYTDGSVSISSVTVSSGQDFAIGEFGISSGASCSSAPAAPQSVTNSRVYTSDNSGAGKVEVDWSAAPSSCVASYNIVAIDAQGNPRQVVDTVPASATSDTIGSLNLCTYYRFGVQAVGAGGQLSAVAFPASPAFTAGYPNASPPVVTIVLQGVNSSLLSGQGATSWNALTTDYCTLTDETGLIEPAALGDLTSNWQNLSDGGKPDYAGWGAGNNLIDSAASTGGLVLPFSYNGATMSGTASSPVFTAQSYTKDDVANSPIRAEAGVLNTEIADISSVLPGAKIIIVGHSNGGLIAQQWWWLYGQYNPLDVVHVFSLDSPINGLYAGTICISQQSASSVACGLLGAIPGISRKLLTTYGQLWRSQDTLNRLYLAADQRDGLYTPIITLGDPLYDAGNYGATAKSNQVPGACDYSTQGTNIGWASQGLLTGCQFASVDEVEVVCNGATSCNDGSSEPFGMTGDLYLHSWVKNSTVTIYSVMRYVSG